jgi:1,4-alpha-glucan branching enzyme
MSLLTDQDIYLFREGTHADLLGKLGCSLSESTGGAHFAVWAPNASAVSVMGDWNNWDPGKDPLVSRTDGSGIWEGDVRKVAAGNSYKYRVTSATDQTFDKADPFAVTCELPPATASRAWSLEYAWSDSAWMSSRAGRNDRISPISIYELHAGSWRRKDGAFLNYRDLAPILADYVNELGFTHVELMPLTEHPFYGSWGYQTTGYFAPTSRYGSPQDFMYFVDYLHQQGIGVILDWVPSHFPTNELGLMYFDGTHLFEHADARQGFHPEWKSAIFNFGRNEVRSFLLSSALFWLNTYHIDGLRVDAVASMLYLDYARAEGQWIPNQFGGRENLEAVQFLRILNQAVARAHPDVAMIAEESTAWPKVSRPIDDGGLGFGFKWNMGWMHDTLAYMRQDPIYRKYHQGQLTFSIHYAFTENFVLPLSHDEVVYGKGSLIGKMPGDDWQKFANLRALYGYMWTHPGKKLLFMGGEFAQRREWTHDGELEWWVADLPEHAGVRRLVTDLNRLYRSEPALYDNDFGRDGFEWVDAGNAEQSVIAFLRKSSAGGAPLLVACNFTPVPRVNYQLGVPARGIWREILNTDAREYGGSGWGNMGLRESAPVSFQGRTESVSLQLPPLATIVLRWEQHG